MQNISNEYFFVSHMFSIWESSKIVYSSYPLQYSHYTDVMLISGNKHIFVNEMDVLRLFHELRCYGLLLARTNQ